MSDLDRLRAVLMVALTACGSSPATKPTGPIGGSAGPSGSDTAPPKAIDAAPAPAPDAAEVTGGPADQMPNFPSCPTLQWCSKSAVAKLAPKDAKDVMGCKSSLESYDSEKDKQKPVPKDWPMAGIAMTLDEAATKAKRDAKDTKTCCYTWVEPCPGGRALVVDGEARTASVTPVDEAEAARWLAEAAAEHASIASFARAMLELMAVDAPLELLDATAAAMRDEIRHTELCLQQAQRFAGRPVALGALPAASARAADLIRLACDVFVEGCVGETVAVVIATRRLAACTDPEIARVFETIVADETRHAALAWQTVRWAIAAEPRAAAAVRALAQIPEAATPTEREVWRAVILPTLDALSSAA